MEEYQPVAADGAAPEGQTRLPWGDEAPAVAVEAHPPVVVEAHPPEPITHFAMPEATFFTAEPPPVALPDVEGATEEAAPARVDEDVAEQPAFEEPAADEPPN